MEQDRDAISRQSNPYSAEWWAKDMGRGRKSKDLRAIQQRVVDGVYRLSDHALVEMDDEGISEEDVVHAVRKATAARKMTGDLRGPRWVIHGPTRDRRRIQVVCRNVGSKVRIVTVYRVR